MRENFVQIKQQLGDLITVNFIPKIKSQTGEQRKFIEQLTPYLKKLEDLIKSSKAKSTILDEVIAVNSQIGTLLDNHFIKKDKKSFYESFPEYSSAIENFITNSEEKVIEIQDEERFVTNKEDEFIFRLVKPVKNLLLNISNIPISVGNIFRKAFKKPILSPKTWERNVRLKKLREYYFKHLLSHELIEIQRKTYFNISKSQLKLKEIYNSLDAKLEESIFGTSEKNDEILSKDVAEQIQDLHNRFDEFERNLLSEIQPILENIKEKYESAYKRAGTLEYPKYKLAKVLLEKIENKQKKHFTLVQAGWQNNLLALNDSFKLNNEIYTIKYKTRHELNSLVMDFRKKINEKIIPSSKKIFDFVSNTKDTIIVSNSLEELLRRFDLIRTEIARNLTAELIPKINNLLIEENIGSLPTEFNNRFTAHLNKVGDERILVPTEEYDSEIKDSEISYISPKEILEYSAAPKIFSSMAKLRSSLNSEIQKIQNVFGEIDHVSDFTIDSAINLLKTDNSSFEESKNTAIEGLERALKNISEADDKFNNLNDTFGNELIYATNNFHAQLKDLTLSDTQFDIKLKLTKAKAIEKSKRFKQDVIFKIKNFVPHAHWLIRKYFRKIKGYFRRVRELLGLAPKAKIISSEISDYLAETHAAIHALPYVYQRLFEIRPLEDRRFYFGRELEVKELTKAFNNWQAGKFSPTVIVGEKGSGSTTLINFFINDLPEDLKIIRTSINFPYYETSDLLAILGNLFGEKIFSNCEDVISYLNNLEYRQVVILENLQRLFLRKVHGFDALKNLFEIISRTNKNVFWITTSTLYCWAYLNKTINAPDHLGYVVKLRNLNENQITELVSKRHRVSGYSEEFEADEETLKSKSFKNLSEPEKQPYLRNNYFTELNEFAQSNISLALLFWLRSAEKILGDKIIIGSPPKLDYSFLENLSNEKIFGLAALLIHDGLREEDYTIIFSVSIKQARQLLLLLYDDGIVVKQNDMYLINPLLYRQIVGLLKARNIIN